MLYLWFDTLFCTLKVSIPTTTWIMSQCIIGIQLVGGTVR